MSQCGQGKRRAEARRRRETVAAGTTRLRHPDLLGAGSTAALRRHLDVAHQVGDQVANLGVIKRLK